MNQAEVKQLIDDLARRGIRIERSPTASDRLRLSPAHRIDRETEERIKRAKPEILRLLSQTGDGDTTPENIRNLLGSVARMGGKLRFLESEGRFSIDLSGHPSRDARAVLEAGACLQSCRPWLFENLDALSAGGWVEIIPVPASLKPSPNRRSWRWN